MPPEQQQAYKVADLQIFHTVAKRVVSSTSVGRFLKFLDPISTLYSSTNIKMHQRPFGLSRFTSPLISELRDILI